MQLRLWGFQFPHLQSEEISLGNVQGPSSSPELTYHCSQLSAPPYFLNKHVYQLLSSWKTACLLRFSPTGSLPSTAAAN